MFLTTESKDRTAIANYGLDFWRASGRSDLSIRLVSDADDLLAAGEAAAAIEMV